MGRNSADIALIVSTYRRPGHLRRALHSIALQRGVEGRFEVVVTDDGSCDGGETAKVVADFAQRVPFPVRFVTHPHQGFRLAHCRNRGMQASSAPYLLFLDGDCLLPPDHVYHHLRSRRPGEARAGDCVRMDEQISASLDENAIEEALFLTVAPLRECWRLWRDHWEAELHHWIRHRRKPKLVGNNMGCWRRDYLRVNGSDQRYQGWGGEDDDLGMRLLRAGVRIRSIRHRTRVYHLWHSPDPSVPRRYRDGANADFVVRSFRLTRCMNGLEQRRMEDVVVRLIGSPPRDGLEIPGRRPGAGERAEVEVLFYSGKGWFSGQADCNILVVSKSDRRVFILARALSRVKRDGWPPIHIIVGDRLSHWLPAEYHFSLGQWSQVFELLG